MITFTFNAAKMKFDPATGIIRASERDVKFDTAYILVNPDTGNEAQFDFHHSTGPEFDPNTEWVYHNEVHNLFLHVINDVVMTAIAAANYKKAKMKNM